MSLQERESKKQLRLKQGGGRNLNRNGQVQEQAEITMHIWPVPDLTTRSGNNLSRRDQSLIYPGGTELPLHDFDEGQFIYHTLRDQSTSSMGHPLKGSADYGWSDLNGLDVSPFGTSERLNENIYHNGICKAQYNPFDDTARSGAATTVYGSKSAQNVVVEPAFVGDRLVHYCPNIHSDQELQTYSHLNLGLSPVKGNKLTPVFKVFDMKDIRYNEFILALQSMHLNREEPKCPYLQIEENPYKYTPEEEASANLQHFIMSIVFVTYTVLANRGIIQLNLKPKTNGKGFEFDPNLASNGFIDVADLLAGQTPHTNEKYQDIKFENDSKQRYGVLLDDDAYFERREAEELFVANLLGLTTGPYLSNADTVEVRNDILKTVFASFTEESLYYALLAGTLEDEDLSDFNVEQELGLDDLPILLSHYTKNMMNIPHNIHQLSTYLNQCTAGANMIATSLGTVVPGVDAIMDLGVDICNYKYK